MKCNPCRYGFHDECTHFITSLAAPCGCACNLAVPPSPALAPTSPNASELDGPVRQDPAAPEVD